MAEILAVTNQKGGVGKSTTAAALGTRLSLAGHRVLFVDFDPQCNMTNSLGIGHDRSGPSLMDLLLAGSFDASAVVETVNGDLLAGDISLVGADITLTERVPVREHALRRVLDGAKELYDFVIIDTPPTLGLLTLNALTAATAAIVPAFADIYSLQGIFQLRQTVDMVRRYHNPTVNVLGIVLTRYDSRLVVTREVGRLLDGISAQTGLHIFDAKIRECADVAKAQLARRSIFDFAPKSNACEDYSALASEVCRLLDIPER